MKNILLSASLLILNCAFLSGQSGNASITISGNSACACDGCFFIVTNNINLPYTLLWSNGLTSTINANPGTVCGFCPGQYSVTVTSNGSPQSVASTSGVITNSPFTPINILSLNPTPCNSDSITGGNQDCERVCAGATVTYAIDNLNPNTSNQFQWQVSGATSWVINPPLQQSITVTWGNSGAGSIQVLSFGIGSCSGEDYLCVTILEPPTAKIGSSPAAAPNTPLQVCKGQVVDFQDISTGDADVSEWFFSDDFSTSNAATVQHTFQNAGTHTVTLISSSLCICSDTTTMTVEVLDALAPALNCVATVCPGETVTYTSSNACAPFTWAVSPNGSILEGGTSSSDSITIIWNDGPDGSISLAAAACSGATCPTAGLIHIPVISDNAEIRGEDRVCPGASEFYTIESFGGVGFVWTLSGGGTISGGQGTNRVSIDWQNFASTTTTYWLSVKYDNCYLGCGGQDSIPVKILSTFIVNGPVEACELANGAFTSTLLSSGSPILCNWRLQGPSGSTVWTSAAPSAGVTVPFTDGIGYYRLFATANVPGETCSDEAEWAIHVSARPAKLTSIKGELKICPGNTYTYEAEGGNPQNNYFWTLQNGAGGPLFYSGRTLNVTWNASGIRTLSAAQVSGDGLGCQSDTIQIQVSNIGIPNITGTPAVCEDTKGSYSIAPLQNVDLQWQITPTTAGSVANGQGTVSAEIFWSQAGNHTVNLTVCGQTATAPVTVFGTPDPVVQAPPGLCPGTTGLVQTSTSFSTYAWKNDAGTILSTTPTLMLGPGTYAVVVTDANGCSGTQEFVIGSYNTPDVSLTTASETGFCNNSLFVPLTALITADADYTFQWFKDGILIPGETNVTYTTNQYGLYTVVATNGQGCTNETDPIVLREECGGGHGCLPCNGVPCPAGTVDLAIDATGRCDSFQMHLLDPTGVYVPGTAQWIVGISGGVVLYDVYDTDPSFTFDNAGEYVAILVVQLTSGLLCNVYDFFGAEAVARFDPVVSCPGIPTNFKDASEFLPSGGIASWAWEFGDPASGANNLSALRTPSHTYSPAGDYMAMLTVTGTSGCTSTASSLVKIPVLPDALFPEPASKCSGNALEFAASANPADITDISWDFGDPASGASNDASESPAYHNFSPAGTYTVTATATNIYGCTASFSRPVTVTPNGLSGTIIPATPPAICEGSSITLTAPAGGVSYLWSDDNASTSNTLTVSEEGTYRVTVTDANGCTYVPPAVKVELNTAPDAIVKALILNDLNQVVGVSYPSIAVCEGENVVLEAFTNGANNYSWSVANGNSPYLYFTDDRNSLLTVGNYTYSVTITNPVTGCTAVSAPFDVAVNPVPSGFSISGTSTCAGNPSTLTYNGPQPANWTLVWNTGLTGATLTTAASGVYQIRVINEFGCEARSNPWTILPGPPVASIPSGCHTRCNPDTLCLPVLIGITDWQWFHNGNPIPGATSSNFIAQQSGTYYAQLTDWYGCTAQSDPLSLELYTGFGNILGQVWSDVNNNGIIDASDTLVSGIPVILNQNGTSIDGASSGMLGDFAFPNVLSTDYTVEIDPLNLPSNWNIVIGQDPVSLLGCDVEDQADLLLHFNCISSSSSLQLGACAGSSVTYQGMAIPAGSTQTVQFIDINGCDSIVTVSVTSWPAASSIELLHACPGASANYAGVDVPVGTSQIFPLQTWHGCDSLVEVYVSPWPTSTGSETLYACPGSSATYAGISIPVGTSQNVTLQNWHGCDSIVTVNVLPQVVSAGTETLHACIGEMVTYNGVNIPVGSSQNVTLTNWLGCDSLVTVNAVAWPNSTGSATLVFACSGGSFTYNGVAIPAGTAQSFTLDTWHGCDSIVTVNVVALPPTTGTETLFACPGGSASYDGTSIAAGSSQSFNKQNWLGCDSIVTVNVAVWPTSTGAQTLFACPGGSAMYDGTAVPVGATQSFTKQNWLGCDSIVTVSVAVWPTSTGAETLFACPGGSAMYNGTAVPVGTTQSFTKANWLGCDSIVTVNVQPWITTNSGFTVGVCPGETFDYQGSALSGGTVQPFTLPNWLGCDSIVTVTVKQLHNSSKQMDVSVCPGKTYEYNNTQIAGGQIQDFHLPNFEGCDSTVTVRVTEYPAASFVVESEKACVNAATGSLEAVMNPGGQAPFQYSINNIDFQDETLFNNLDAGDYQVFMEDANNCIFIQPATIVAIPALEINLPNGILPCDDPNVTLAPILNGGDTATVNLKWWDGSTSATAVATEAGPVWVEATDKCGTERSEAQVEWAELNQDLSIVYVPNVMKPTSNDPENARFRPIFAAGINLLGFKFMVFDRWGNELFQTQSTADAWDGIFQSEKMNPGVQVWYLEADVSICGRIIHVKKKGDVTVVR